MFTIWEKIDNAARHTYCSLQGWPSFMSSHARSATVHHLLSSWRHQPFHTMLCRPERGNWFQHDAIRRCYYSLQDWSWWETVCTKVHSATNRVVHTRNATSSGRWSLGGLFIGAHSASWYRKCNNGQLWCGFADV